MKNDFKNPYFWLLIAISVGILTMPWLLTQSSKDWFGINFIKTGPIGDTIGGITAPFVGLVAAWLVYKSFMAQIEANKQITADRKIDLLWSMIEDAQEKTPPTKHIDSEFSIVIEHVENPEKGIEPSILSAVNEIYYLVKYYHYIFLKINQMDLEEEDKSILLERLAHVYEQAEFSRRYPTIVEASENQRKKKHEFNGIERALLIIQYLSVLDNTLPAKLGTEKLTIPLS